MNTLLFAVQLTAVRFLWESPNRYAPQPRVSRVREDCRHNGPSYQTETKGAYNPKKSHNIYANFSGVTHLHCHFLERWVSRSFNSSLVLLILKYLLCLFFYVNCIFLCQLGNSSVRLHKVSYSVQFLLFSVWA